MITFLEKLKKFGGTVKDATKSTAKTIAQKTPEAAETLTEKTKELTSEVKEQTPKVIKKTKEIASTVTEKTEEVVSSAKLRLKLYNLNKKIEKRMGELGGFAFECITQGKTDVYEDSDVKRLIQEINTIKKRIKETEQEIQNLEVDEKEEADL